jgi:hypothetical protein
MKTWKLYRKENKTSGYNGLYITKLKRNFRSHQLILKLPNRMFYDGELMVSMLKTSQFCSFHSENDPLTSYEEHFFFLDVCHVVW